MKKLLITALILAFASSAYAYGTGVVASLHNIPATKAGAKGVVDEATAEGGRNRVCGFCHTPHHADQDGADEGLPLWSRAQSAKKDAYTDYYSFTIDGSEWDDGYGDAMIGASWLCLSCHDGQLAVDQHYNFTGDTMVSSSPTDLWGDPTVGLAGNLTNDHPIGVDMVKAEAAERASGQQSGLVLPTTGVFKGNAAKLGTLTISNFLFEGKYVTCSSCHDVHDKDSVNEPYMLYSSLDNSDICTSCHLK